jgi:hypothetical protein
MTRPKPSVDLGYPTEPHGRIPAFQNIEEEAAFWDTHSFTDFTDESSLVEVAVSKNLSDPVTVRLDAEDRADVARRAKAIGVGPSTLVRMWVKEHLKREA